MSESFVKNVVEAAMLAAGKPLQVSEFVQLFEENPKPQAADIRAAIKALATEYEGRGIEVKETAAGFRIQVRRELANEISRLWPERPPRYSRALLETLALIAYRQPITRAEIEAVRGVAVNPNIVKTLIERNWVQVVGNRDVPGRPELLGTTKDFLDYFGLKRLDELPPLAELKVLGDVNLELDLPEAGAPQAQVDGETGTPETSTEATQATTDEGAGPAASDSEEGEELAPRETGATVSATAAAVEADVDDDETAEDEERAADESDSESELLTARRRVNE